MLKFIASLLVISLIVVGAALAEGSGAPPSLPGDLPAPFIMPIVTWPPLPPTIWLPEHNAQTGEDYLVEGTSPENPEIWPERWKWNDECNAYERTDPIAWPDIFRRFNADGTYKDYQWDGESWQIVGYGSWGFPG